MKSRLLWAAVVLAALAAFYYTTIRPTHTPAPGLSKKLRSLRHAPPPEIPPPPLPEPVMTMPTLALPPLAHQPIVLPPVVPRREERQPMVMELPIPDNATVDFSRGAPEVRTVGKDKEALDKAIREMAEATKETSFPPTKK